MTKKTNRRIRILSLLVALVMLVGLLPAIGVTAAADQWLTFTVASKRMYSSRYLYLFNMVISDAGEPDYGYAYENIPSGKWDYNASTYTLNLHDGFDFETTGRIGMYLTNDESAPITIHIDGDVKISGKDFGLFVSGEAIITGDGTLTLENTTDNDFASYANWCRPAALVCYDGLTVSEDVTVIAKGTSAGMDGAPITITDNAKIVATGNRAAALSYSEPFAIGTDIAVKGSGSYVNYTNLADVASVPVAEVGLLGDDLYQVDYYTLAANGAAVKSAVMVNVDNDDFSTPIPYLVRAWNGTAVEESLQQLSLGQYTPVTSDTVVMNDGWYVVTDDTTINSRVEISGTVNLVLCDGTTLNLPFGLHLGNGNTLNIYGQENDTGKLKSSGHITQPGNAGIGGNSGSSGGDLTVYGGDIYATSSIYAAAIGGGWNGSAGSFTMYGGTVEAHGSISGIGKGLNGDNGTLTVYGGVNIYAGGNAPGMGTTVSEYQSNRTAYVRIVHEDHIHTWLPATCTQPQICSECGESAGQTLEHSWEFKEVISEATCTQAEICREECTVCHNSQTVEGTPALGHDYVQGDLISEATCKKPAVYRSECSRCHQAVDLEVGDTAPHQFVNGICTMCGQGPFVIDKYGMLVQYLGNGGDVVIPSGVKAIGSNVFADRVGINSVEIPEGVTEIEFRAFANCGDLASVTLPDSLEEIHDDAFSSCFCLTDITLPNSLTGIGEYAFANCTGLTSIIIPDGVTAIDQFTFSGCTNLADVTFGNDLNRIGYDAFAYCRNLKSITLPESVRRIDSSAFWGCTSLTEITVTDSIPEICDDVFMDTAISVVYYPCGNDLDSIMTAYRPYVRQDASWRAVHDYSELLYKISDATCTEPAVYAAKCAECESTSDAVKVGEPTGHIWNDGEITVQPTATSEGEKTYICTVCGETKTEAVPKLAKLFDMSLTPGKVEADTTPDKYQITWDLNVEYNSEINPGDYDFNVFEYGIKYAANEQDLADYMGGTTPIGTVVTREYATSGAGLAFVYKTTRYHLHKVAENRKRYAIGYIRYELDGQSYETYTVIDCATTYFGGLIGGTGDPIDLDDGLQD